MNKKFLFLPIACLLASCGQTPSSSDSQGGNSTPESAAATSEKTSVVTQYDYEISNDTYFDKTLGGLTAELWGNFSGLPTEFKFINSINPAYVEWKVGESYSTDDDTSLEYVWTHIMETYGVNKVNYADIRYEFLTHIRDMIWVGNLNAHDLMASGLLPPYTGMKGYNPTPRAIDAQIESEIFGCVSPGMVENAISRAMWWMRAIGDTMAVECAAFYAGLAAKLYVCDDIRESIEYVMQFFDEESSAYSIAANVIDLYDGLYPGFDNWVRARNALYSDYYLRGTQRNDTLDCEINFAMTLLSLIYGESDFEQTGQIALRAGFDNDCNAATACFFMGILLGYSGLPQTLKDKSGNMYYNTNRPGLPDTSLTEWSNKLLKLGSDNIVELCGAVSEEKVCVIDAPYEPVEYDTIYQSSISILDENYTYEPVGFKRIYNPELLKSNAYFSSTKDSTLTVEFTGDHVYLYGLTCIEGGQADLYIDNVNYGLVQFGQTVTNTLGSDINHIATTIVKCVRGLSDGKHTLKLKVTSENGALVTFEGIGFDISEEEYYGDDTDRNIALSSTATAITSVPQPLGPGSGSSTNINVIRDGYRLTSNQFDTFLGYQPDGVEFPKDFEDYFGITFSKDVTISKVVFVEGGHWAGGGWFANGEVRVEVLVGETWTEVASEVTPDYPVSNTQAAFGQAGEAYTFTFESVTCKGVRVIGTPGGPQKLISCCEFEVYC